MKKLFIVSLGFIFAAAVPAIALAASLSLSPSSGSYTVGNSYSVNVYVDPQSSKIYTAKVEVDYPANLLQVRGFAPASGVTALTQPGYDSTDNTNGVLIKTVGFPSGVSSSALIGTITFYAKASGTAPVSISSSNSKTLDSNLQNAATSFGTASYVLAVVAAAPVPQNTSQTSVPAKTSVKTIAKSTSSKAKAGSTSPASTSPSTAATSSQTAAVGEFGSPNSVMLWVVALIAGVLVFGSGYYTGSRKRMS